MTEVVLLNFQLKHHLRIHVDADLNARAFNRVSYIREHLRGQQASVYVSSIFYHTLKTVAIFQSRDRRRNRA